MSRSTTVITDPPSLHAELEAARRRNEARNPACPHCGRRTAERFIKPHGQKSTFRCVCGKEWQTAR